MKAKPSIDEAVEQIVTLEERINELVEDYISEFMKEKGSYDVYVHPDIPFKDGIMAGIKLVMEIEDEEEKHILSKATPNK